MKRKILFILVIIIFAIIVTYPNIEFYINNTLYMMSYSKNWEDSEDLKELEQEICYDESYSYNKRRNISIIKWEYKGFLFLQWFKIKYKKGNICETEYLLEESYIKHFLESAEVKYNDDNVDVANLIKNKTVITSNKRYPSYDNSKYIGYILDGKYMDMFITETEEGLIIIQVGLGDEGPKFIAYQ